MAHFASKDPKGKSRRLFEALRMSSNIPFRVKMISLAVIWKLQRLYHSFILLIYSDKGAKKEALAAGNMRGDEGTRF